MSTITAGLVAAGLLYEVPSRFFSMHLQDIDMREPERPQVALGQGGIDWVKNLHRGKGGRR